MMQLNKLVLKRMSKENNGREAALANVIREYMSDLKLLVNKN